MTVVCPNCKQPIEFAEQRPGFCSHCGQSLSEVDIHAAATVPFAPAPSTSAAGDSSLGGERPRVVGRYRLGRELGQGGMGVVYEAEHEDSGRRVALKVLTPGLAQSQESMQRFLREGRLAAALSHARSTFVYEAGEHAGQPYIAMELMPGRTLHHVSAEEGALPVNRAVDYILDVIDGLEAAHAVGVIHRDVKPSNCFLDDSGRVKVGDFGLSKSLVTDAALTRTGAFMGTPLFAAPEQVRAGRIDERTDIYAVGATLFFLIARRGPFVGDPAAVIAQISSDPAPSLRALVPTVPKDLDTIIARTLEKDPERRYANLGQLRQALLPFATGGTSIADVGRRLGAYMVDRMVSGLIVGIGYGIAGVVATSQLAESGATRRVYSVPMLIAATVTWLVQIGYFVIAEGRWGHGVGKWLLGIRVVGVSGEPPGMARMLLRAFFVPGGFGATLAVSLTAAILEQRALTAEGNTSAFNLGVTLLGLLAYAPELLCLVTMRRDNGYRGVHELASGTRVVRLRRAADEARPRDVPILAPIAVRNGSRVFGPFRELGLLGQSDRGTIRVARDDILHRPVWVHLSDAQSVGFTAGRIGIVRPTRTRWLQGGVSGDVRWDAFEAVVGAPLAQTAALDGGLNWERGRVVLLDLAEELRAAISDNTLPQALTLEQVWIDRSGHVKLLDEAIVPPAKKTVLEASRSTPLNLSASDEPSASLESAHDAQAAGRSAKRAWELLQSAGQLCSARQPLPGHAQEFLHALATRPATIESLHWAADNLRDLSRRTAVLRWDDRLGILGVTMGTEYTFYWTVGLIIALASWDLIKTPSLRLIPPLLFDLIVPAVLGAWLRGGPVFWFTGIEVRRPDGRRAGPMRCAWRSIVAWFPLIEYNSTLPFMINMKPTTYETPVITPEQLIVMLLSCSGACMISLTFVGLIYGVIRPQRGVQDLLAGTCLVPR